MKKITTCLWFNDNAEAAVKFYASVFKKVKVGKTARYAEGTPGPAGKVMTITFKLFDQEFIALNGGPLFKFNESISFVVNCETQREIDYYWKKLIAGGGKPSQCGWLKDRFGVSWQIAPSIVGDLIATKDKAKAERVMAAILQMTKIDLKRLKQAAKAPR